MRYTVSIDGLELEIEVFGDHLQVGDRDVAAKLTPIPHTPLRRLELGDRAFTVAMTKHREGWMIERGGERWLVAVIDERTRQLRELTGDRGTDRKGGLVKAPMPGLVLRLEVEVGQRVSMGAGVVVLEAMKMENEITAIGEGVVKAVLVSEGQTVEKGTALVEIGEA